MAETFLDSLKKLGAAILDRVMVPVGIVDDTPPTYADGDIKPVRMHKDNRGIYVHVANAADISGGGGGGAVTQGAGATANPWYILGLNGSTPERLATQELQGAGLPAAFTGGGGVKVGLVDSIPAGTNTIGKAAQGAGDATNPWGVQGVHSGAFERLATNENLTALRYKIDPIWEAVSTGLCDGKIVRLVTVMGNRTSFQAAGVPNDVGNHLGLAAAEFTNLTGTEVLEFISTSTADSAAGTGVRSVLVTYIDVTGAEATATFALNGTTAVNLGSLRALHIQHIEATDTGTNRKAVGTITLRIVGPGAVIETITIGDNQSFSARYMVPTGRTIYIFSMPNAARNQDMQVRLLANVLENNTPVPHFVVHNLTDAQDGNDNLRKLPYHKFTEGTKIKVAAVPVATSASPRCLCILEMVEIEN